MTALTQGCTSGGCAYTELSKLRGRVAAYESELRILRSREAELINALDELRRGSIRRIPWECHECGAHAWDKTLHELWHAKMHQLSA